MKKTKDVRLKVLFDGSCSREVAEKAMSMNFMPKQGVFLMAETEKTKVRELDSLHCLLEEMAKIENEMPKVTADE